MHLRVIPRKNDILKGFIIIRTLKLTYKIRGCYTYTIINHVVALFDGCLRSYIILYLKTCILVYTTELIYIKS